MKSRLLTMSALVAVTLSASAYAQGGPGGPGKGPGPGMHEPGSGAGMGPGMHSRQADRVGPNTTPGWSMMTPAERTEHRNQMHSMKTQEECKAYMSQHHEQMAARAKEKGIKVPGQPRHDACAGMKP